MEHILKVLSIEPLTPDVHAFRLEKPADYRFIPGQATEVAIRRQGWRTEKRPFTFTSLNEDQHLEFIIKSYSDHDGVTKELLTLTPGDELIVDEPWGAIEYKGAGYFFAGGAGITPFLSIFRQLSKDQNKDDNQLFFSNRTAKDIILKHELNALLHNKVFHVLTNDNTTLPYFKGYIDETFITTHVSDFSKKFYVCGPAPMVESINNILVKHGASPEAVVFEK